MRIPIIRYLQMAKAFTILIPVVCLYAVSMPTYGQKKQDRVARLIHDLKNPDAGVRLKAATQLEAIRDERAVNPLTASLMHPVFEVRTHAAEALGKIEDARAVEALLAAVKEKDLVIVAGCHEFLIARGQDGTAPLLIEALWKHGDNGMAITYFTSENPILKEGAQKWASQHGVRFMRLPGLGAGPAARWGSKRP